jgi:hypothetical protein
MEMFKKSITGLGGQKKIFDSSGEEDKYALDKDIETEGVSVNFEKSDSPTSPRTFESFTQEEKEVKPTNF